MMQVYLHSRDDDRCGFFFVTLRYTRDACEYEDFLVTVEGLALAC